MNFSSRTMVLVAILLAAPAVAQGTLTQSTNNVTITPLNSLACGSGNPINNTTDNSYFRSYGLSGQPGPINITSIRFGVELVQNTLAGGRPMIIRLWNDPNGGAPSPISTLQLRKTETFTLPASGSVIITQPMTGAPVTFAPNEFLVVEIFSLAGGAVGNTFFIGSNALGQTAQGYFRSPACGVSEPVSFASLGYTNVHVIIDVNYVPSSQAVPFPGTGEDLTLYSGINANPLTTGFGNTVKTCTAGNVATIRVVSNGNTFNYRELVLAAQGYTTGAPPFPPVAPNVFMTFPGLIMLIGGDPGPLGPALLPPGGTTLVFTVPPGLAGHSAIFQGIVITWGPPFAINGLYASTDGHEIRIL